MSRFVDDAQVAEVLLKLVDVRQPIHRLVAGCVSAVGPPVGFKVRDQLMKCLDEDNVLWVRGNQSLSELIIIKHTPASVRPRNLSTADNFC